MVCTVLFVVAYFSLGIGDDWDTFAGLGASNVALGVTLGLAPAASSASASSSWARKLMADAEIVEYAPPRGVVPRGPGRGRRGARQAARRVRHRSSPAGAQHDARRRGPDRPPAVVGLRDLGPLPGDKLLHTIWETGMRVVRDVTGTPILPSDMQIGDLVNAQPEALFPTEENGYPELDRPGDAGREGQGVDHHGPDGPRRHRAQQGPRELVCRRRSSATPRSAPTSAARSRCTSSKTHHVLCPCHQSTFDLADSAKVIFGPAGRAIPQLPIAVDEEGYLVAQSDFTEPVGPSYWERDSS